MSEGHAVATGARDLRGIGRGRAAYGARVAKGEISSRLDLPTLGAWASLSAGADHGEISSRTRVDRSWVASLVGAGLARGDRRAQGLILLMNLTRHPAGDGFTPVWTQPRSSAIDVRIGELANLHALEIEPLDELMSAVASWCMRPENARSPWVAPMAELLADRPDHARRMLEVAEYSVPAWISDVVRLCCHRHAIARATGVYWRGHERERAVMSFLESEPLLDPREILSALVPLYDLLAFQPQSDHLSVLACKSEQSREARILREGPARAARCSTEIPLQEGWFLGTGRYGGLDQRPARSRGL